jgi:thiol-disulfide isomerase/thioredoxin
MSITTVITAQRYSQAFTYEDYLNQLSETRQRFAEHQTAFQLEPIDAQFFKDIVQRLGQIKVLALVEDWCPDVQRGLPIMAAIAQASGMDMRVFPRDKNIDIMNLYLNQGRFMSIPVFAFFDQNLNPLCHWIGRPNVATQFMEEITAELTEKKLSEEELRQERRKRSQLMVDSWRQETVKELRELFTEIQPSIG